MARRLRFDQAARKLARIVRKRDGDGAHAGFDGCDPRQATAKSDSEAEASALAAAADPPKYEYLIWYQPTNSYTADHRMNQTFATEADALAALDAALIHYGRTDVRQDYIITRRPRASAAKPPTNMCVGFQVRPAQPPAEELEAQCEKIVCKVWGYVDEMKELEAVGKEFAAFIRARERERERELLEKLEGLAQKWDEVAFDSGHHAEFKEGHAYCAEDVRAFIAAQREGK